MVVAVLNPPPSYAGIAHCSDQLASAHEIPYQDVTLLSMEELVNVSIFIFDADCPIVAFSCLDHLSRNGRAKSRVVLVEPRLLPTDIVEVDTPICGGYICCVVSSLVGGNTRLGKSFQDIAVPSDWFQLSEGPSRIARGRLLDLVLEFARNLDYPPVAIPAISTEASLKICHRLLPIALMLSAATAAPAQESTTPGPQKWRPKDGIYAVPGPDHATRCGDQAEAYVELKENFIGGNEYGCSIKNMTDIAAGRIRIEALCDDAQTDKSSKESILLKRIDDNTFSWSEINARGNSAGVTFAYCPEDAQRTYRENAAKSKREAEQNASQARPQKP